MSSATWRSVFTYVIHFHANSSLLLINIVVSRYNKYAQITARALRQSLKEEQRVAAEKRGLTALKYQHWEDGKGGEQASLLLLTIARNPWFTDSLFFTKRFS
jgi:F-type H+-transporting ATPase subunit epsilon